jgi:ATP-binding protein involved in chromosome partitioning
MSAADPTEVPPPTVEEIRAELDHVIDPELRASIVELGMVDDVVVAADGAVTVKVALTTAACPLRGVLKNDVEQRLLAVPSVTDVRVVYGEMTSEQRSRAMGRARFNAREQAAPTEVPASARVLAVASGKGGVGKSSVSVNLAVALAAQGHTVGLLDADIWGFSVPRMLGLEGRLGGAAGKIHPHERSVPPAEDGGLPGRLKVVSTGFLVDDEQTALMWRGLVLTKALEQFLTDVRWGEMDYLVVDMPPGTGDVQMGLARMLPQAEMLIVTTPALAAQMVAARVADMARRSHMPIVGVVENMTAFIAPTGERYALFGEGGGEDLARSLGVPLLAQIPLEPDVARGGDEGTPVVEASPDRGAGAAFAALAARIVELLPPVEMAGCTARILEAARKLAQA